MNQPHHTTRLTEASTTSPLSPLAQAVNAPEHIHLVQARLRDPVVREALDTLYNTLPADLYYHNIQHTLDVFEHALLLGRHAGLSSKDLQLLAIAAAWHDTGFIKARHHNESFAAEWARESMESAGTFSRSEIADVTTAILDTEMMVEDETGIRIQRAVGRLSPWLLDADLSNFGRPSFFKSTLKIFRENFGTTINSVDELCGTQQMDFLTGSLRMLQRHRWQTAVASQLLQQQKEINIAKLSALIKAVCTNSLEERQQAWQGLEVAA